MSKTVTRADGATFKLGRRRPVAKGMRLHLASYLHLAGLPTPPPVTDYTQKAAEVLSQLYGNDQYGDCVIAGGYHVIGAETSLVMQNGSGFVASLDQVLADYSAITGFNPSDPSSDRGTDEPTAFNYWTETGFADGSKLKGWLAVDTTNLVNIKSACWLFENLFFAIELPDAWISPIPSASGFVWDVAGDPNPNNGHCVVGLGYNAQGVIIATWGMIGLITWNAIQLYCKDSMGGALYTLLTEDQIDKAKQSAPNGLNYTQLIADFDYMGGLLPTTPAPALKGVLGPGALPEVHPRVSEFQCQQWATSDLRIPNALTPLQQRQLIAKIQQNITKHYPR